MDDPLIPDIFAVITCCAALVFLWEVVLTNAKDKLRVEDHNAAKFLLTMISLPLMGVAIYYCGSILGQFDGTAGPF
jgi:hypothetical protein